MFTIAICDDDRIFCDQLEYMVKDYMKDMGIEYEVLVYYSIQNISYDVMENMVYDMLFLDIEFPKEEKDGVYLGNYLRKMQGNNYSQIVFVSSKEEYAMQLFQIRPMDFLIKPLDILKLNATLERALYLQNVGKKVFTYYFGTREYRVEISKILYFESNGRKIKIVCNDNSEFRYNGKIADAYSQLCDSKFFSPHKSFLVNYYAIEQWNRKMIKMVNGDCIPVSRNKMDEMHELQLKYKEE